VVVFGTGKHWKSRRSERKGRGSWKKAVRGQIDDRRLKVTIREKMMVIREGNDNGNG